MKYLFIFLSILPFCTSQAQTTNTYVNDITALHDILQKTPSYKDQIKGQQNAASYNKLFEKLKLDSVNNVSEYKYFYNLAKLFFPIRDNHLGFYQIIDKNNFKDRATFEKYMGSKEFKNFPKCNLNIDSLKDALSKKPIDSIEGIYYLDTLFSVGLFKAKDKEYIGVVLSSKITYWRNLIWKNGEIAIHLYEYLPNYYKAIYTSPITKGLILYSNEKFRNLSLINSEFYGFDGKRYSKVLHQQDYTNLPRNINDFQFKNIQSNIQYLRIKHFSADLADMKKSKAFIDSIKPLITAPNLIVDLRNNEGGAIKVSKNFLALIKDYVKNGHVNVLVNNGTISQGEIFTLQLKQLDNVQVLGQTTNGTLMYGSNYGKTEKLPSKAFQVYITDMDGDKRLIPYEVFGVNPDVTLSNTSDWVEQTVEIIGKK